MRLRSVLVAIAVVLLSGVMLLPKDSRTNAQSSISPTPEYWEWFPPPVMALSFACPQYTRIVTGSSWYGITVGKSTQTEFENFLITLDSYIKVSSDTGDELTSTVYLSQERGDVNQTPNVISICTHNGIITVLYLRWPEKNTYYLKDVVAKYGPYDAVTWTLGTTFGRVVFWFKSGVAADVFVGSDKVNHFGEVSDIIYFLPQDVAGYQSRWPYNKTWPSENSEDALEGIITTQNPFDLTSMFATLTAQPTLTSTYTFTPRSEKGVISIKSTATP